MGNVRGPYRGATSMKGREDRGSGQTSHVGNKSLVTTQPKWGPWHEHPGPGVPTARAPLAGCPAGQVVVPAPPLTAWTCGSRARRGGWGGVGWGGGGAKRGKVGGRQGPDWSRPPPRPVPSSLRGQCVAAIQQDRTQQPEELQAGRGGQAWKGNVVFDYECPRAAK